MNKENWIWMPHAGHLCVGYKCRFHLSTYVGGYVVSTVGEWVPPEILMKKWFPNAEGDKLEQFYLKEKGFKEIGLGRIYETMVFRAEKNKETTCCPYLQKSGEDVDMKGYMDACLASEGHMKMCEKWAKNSAS